MSEKQGKVLRFKDGRIRFPTNTKESSEVLLLHEDVLKEDDLTMTSLFSKELLWIVSAYYSIAKRRWEFKYCNHYGKADIIFDMQKGWFYWTLCPRGCSFDGVLVYAPRTQDIEEFEVMLGIGDGSHALYPAWGYSLQPGLALTAINKSVGYGPKQHWSLTMSGKGKYKGRAVQTFKNKKEALELAARLDNVDWIKLTEGDKAEIEKFRSAYAEAVKAV